MVIDRVGNCYTAAADQLSGSVTVAAHASASGATLWSQQPWLLLGQLKTLVGLAIDR